MTTFFVLLFLTLAAFLIWYFFFNIYEVKFQTKNEEKLNPNSEIKIEYFGVNSFGQKLSFRKIPIKLEIIEGKELIEKVDSSKQNRISIFTKPETGNIKILLNSKFSLNPSVFTFTMNN